MCEVVIVYLYGTGTFIEYLPVTGSFNATLTAVDHWDAHLGLRLTTLVLYCTLTCRPKIALGRSLELLVPGVRLRPTITGGHTQ